jgi:exosortase A-associated hydrolase 2
MSVVTPSATITPFFLEPAPQRRVFALLFAPPVGITPRAPVLHVAAFAEEMNKSRRTVALAARAFAAAGAPTLIIDPTGTGDSSHDFADARWESWLEDYVAAYDWLTTRYTSAPTLWALRFGALLLPALAAIRPSITQSDWLLWHPALSGQQLLTQFLRLKLAADVAQGAALESGAEAASAAKGPDTKELRRRLQAGESLEIAGYALAGPLAVALDQATLNATHVGPSSQVGCFELAGQASATPALTPVMRKFVGELRSKSVAVVDQAFAEPAFWSTPEITTAPQLIAASAQFLGNRGVVA